LVEVGKGFDVVHLFCDVAPGGNIADNEGRETAAIRLIQRCSESDVKLLWLANENKPEGYIKGFNVAERPVNLVLTNDRKNLRFTSFLERLLRKMSREKLCLLLGSLCHHKTRMTHGIKMRLLVCLLRVAVVLGFVRCFKSL